MPPVQPPSSAERQWIIAMHLCPLIGVLVPLGSVIAPLVLWLVKRPDSPAIDAVGKDVLNFQISISIYFLVGFLLLFVLIGGLVLLAVVVLWIYGIIMAGVKASNGEPFKYPLSITFLK